MDQAILAEEERAVVIRFGHDWDETCMQVNLSSSPVRSLDFPFRTPFMVSYSFLEVSCPLLESFLMLSRDLF